MENFPEFNFEGLGGIESFKYIPLHDVQEIPHTYNELLASAVIIKTGKSWYTGLALPKSLSFQEQYTKDDTIKYSISGRITGSDQVLVPLFDDMARRSFIIDITDRNRSRRLVGTLINGMKFSWKHDTKEGASDRNEFSFEFTAELAEPAKIYNPV